MPNRYTRLRIIDLDSVIMQGNKLYTHILKSKGDKINLGGCLYLMELISTSIKANDSVVVLCRTLNQDLTKDLEKDLSKDVMSFRDIETKIQYEICVDKLSRGGINVLPFNTQEELVNATYLLAREGKQEFARVQVYTENVEDVYSLVGKGATYTVVNSKAINGQYFQSIAEEGQIPFNAYLAFSIFKRCFEGDTLCRFVNDYGTFVKDIVETTGEAKSYADIRLIHQFILKSYEMDKISEESAGIMVGALREKLELMKKSMNPDWDKFNAYNMKGLNVFLKMLRMDNIMEYLELDRDIKLGISDKEYIQNKISSVNSIDVIANNGLSLTTDHFAKETVTVMSNNGQLVKVTTEEDKLEESVDEFLADFLE